MTFNVKITKKDLQVVPEEELKFLLVAFKKLDKIITQRRLVVKAQNEVLSDGWSEMDKRKAVSEFITLLLWLAGELREISKTVHNVYLSKPWHKEHRELISPSACSALTHLNTFRKRDKILLGIRNYISSHTDADYLYDQYLAEDESIEFSMILSDKVGDTNYLVSEDLAMSRLLGSIGEGGDPQDGMNELYELIDTVANNTIQFLNEAIAVSLTRHNVIDKQAIQS